jgi:CheY-like chemotaxis protein
VVDDYQDWRRLVSESLQQTGDFEVVKQVCDGLEAVQQAEELQPDLILLDIGLPNLNGLEGCTSNLKRLREFQNPLRDRESVHRYC